MSSTAQTPVTPPVLAKFFLEQRFIKIFVFFGKSASKPFRKEIYVPTNNLKLRSYSRKIRFNSSNFSANFNFGPKFRNEIPINLSWSYKVQLISFPKCHHSSKSIHGYRRYLRFCVRKPVRLTEFCLFFYSTSFSANLTGFLTQN